MAPLSCTKRAEILELHNPSSQTPLSISQIARRPHTCRETVRQVLRRVMETGTLHYDMPRSGRPRILEEALLGTLQDHHLNPCTFIFQQDNDRKHTSKLAQRWFDDQNILLLPWPSSSPNMNIIEHVWSELDRRVRARNPLPATVTSYGPLYRRSGTDLILLLFKDYTTPFLNV